MRKFLVLLLCAVWGVCAHGQQHYASNISVGVKAGTTLSQTMFSPGIDQSFLFGYTGGAIFRYIEEKHFGLIAEFNFQQRGWKEVFENTDYKFQRQLSYLQIPLLAHVYFGGEKARFFFNAGPEIGFMISEKTKANFDIYNIASIPDFPIKNRNTDQFTMDIKGKIDYGISAGLGMELFANPKNSIVLEGRFYYGLNNIFSAHKKDVFAASNGMSILVTLGYMFRLK